MSNIAKNTIRGYKNANFYIYVSRYIKMNSRCVSRYINTVKTALWIPPPFCASFLMQKDSLTWGDSYLRLENFKVRFFWERKFVKVLLRTTVWCLEELNNLNLGREMLILRFLLWSKLILLCVLMEMSWKMKENVHHAMKKYHAMKKWQKCTPYIEKMAENRHYGGQKGIH